METGLERCTISAVLVYHLIVVLAFQGLEKKEIRHEDPQQSSLKLSISHFEFKVTVHVHTLDVILASSCWSFCAQRLNRPIIHLPCLIRSEENKALPFIIHFKS